MQTDGDHQTVVLSKHIHTDRHADKQTRRQADRQTDTQTQHTQQTNQNLINFFTISENFFRILQ